MGNYKLKIGDRVRCVVAHHGNETVGKIYEVAEDYTDGEWFRVVADDNGRPNAYYVRDFKIEEDTSELARLVRVANEGYRAHDEIKWKYAEEVQISSDNTNGIPEKIIWAPTNRQFHIKPKKPSFTPFTTSEGYEVLLSQDGTKLDIGCVKNLPAEETSNRFADAFNGSTFVFVLRGLSFHPGRNGLETNQGNLTWASVKQVVDALKKAGY